MAVVLLHSSDPSTVKMPRPHESDIGGEEKERSEVPLPQTLVRIPTEQSLQKSSPDGPGDGLDQASISN